MRKKLGLTFVFLFILVIFFCGCKPAKFASLAEQIAIFENLGFVKISPQQSTEIYPSVTILGKDQIFDALQNNNITASDYWVLYLKDADKLVSVISVLELTSAADAQKTKDLCFKNGYCAKINHVSVIIKIESEQIFSHGQSEQYFSRFVGGLKNK